MASFERTSPERYSAAGTRPASRVVVDQLAERAAGLVGLLAEQRCDLLEVDAAVGVEADRERVLRAVGAQPRGAGRDDPLGEQRGGRRLLGAVVEHLQRPDERRERIAAQQLHRSRGDPGQPLLAALGVGVTGPAVGEAVDRPVAGDVAGVAVAQPAAELGELGGVLARRGLGGEQLARQVAQLQQLSQLDAVSASDVERLHLPAVEDRERPVAGGGEMTVPQALRGRGSG